MNKKGMLGRLIGGFVAILIGLSILPTISKEIEIATNSVYNESINTTAGALSNVTATSTIGYSVLKLVPGFFVLAILGIGIAIAYSALRDAGMFGNRDEDEDYEDEDYEEEKPKPKPQPKQTIKPSVKPKPDTSEKYFNKSEFD